jgi:ATP-dependent RNA helicase DDX19/DBP5
MNTKSFANKLLQILKERKIEVAIIFGDMEPNERDEYMAKFRKGEVKTVITTNLLARGIDVPEVEFVINFDVPVLTNGKGNILGGDPETYLHRIGRAGRFGVPGIAITLLDREQDKPHFDEIIEHFDMTKKVTVLRDAEHLKEVYQSLSDI